VSGYQSFQPRSRVLMGPGPSDVHPRVLEALSRPTIGHLDPQFQELMSEIKELLRVVFQTRNELTFPVSAPGSAGMETCFANLVEPGDKVLVCTNGVFGKRMQENVNRLGGELVNLDFEWGEPVCPKRVEETLAQHQDTKILAFVHAETSTGVLSNASELAKIAQNANVLTIVDTVTSLAGSELKVDEWGLDAVYSGTQKCLSCVPGISPVTFSQKALDKVKGRQSLVSSWFLDLNLVLGYWGEGKRSYHHTAPVNSMYALHEALVLVVEEGLKQCIERHKKWHSVLMDGLVELGFEPLVAPEYRIPQLNAVKLPEGLDEAALRQELLNRFDLEVGAGLGPFAGKIWRIGLMGNSCNERNVVYCLSALKECMKR